MDFEISSVPSVVKHFMHDLDSLTKIPKLTFYSYTESDTLAKITTEAIFCAL